MWILKIFACGARYARGSTPSTPVFEKFWHGGWAGAKFFNNHVFIVPPIGFLHEKTNVANRPKQKPMSSTGFYIKRIHVAANADGQLANEKRQVFTSHLNRRVPPNVAFLLRLGPSLPASSVEQSRSTWPFSPTKCRTSVQKNI